MQHPLKRPTLRDVAENAGVAVSTVSSILNGRTDSWASQETKERVFAAARALNYRPNRMAQALRSSHFRAATLVVPDLTNPFFALLARAIQRSMEQAGYELLIEDSEGNLEREKKILNDVASHNTDGVILILSTDSALHAERLDELSRTFPVVQIGLPMPGSRIDTLQSDWTMSLRKAIDHLMKLGHRSLGFVDSMAGRNDVLGRVATFRNELKQVGLTLDQRNLVRCHHEVNDVRVATGRWASETVPGERASAFICTNDFTALGTIRGLLDAGLSVPDDISVVGFDDIPLASYLPRPLTTIAQPMAQMAAAASQILLDRISGKMQGPATHHIFATSLIIRESTAQPPKNSY
ncbi:MAG: LacI family DNA-binding transcriptional regulator [Verrucomicrobia bacterium]|nr:LacI family DNA-binding transcriptional regulator [Verrucomicrobiota bacterium]